MLSRRLSNDEHINADCCFVSALCASCPLYSALVRSCHTCMNDEDAEQVTEKIYIKSIPEA